MATIRLIATDLDGTLIGPEDEQDLYDAFRDQIDSFRREQNCIWVICTGRDLKKFQRVFLLMEHYGIMPDFVILKHAYIYRVIRSRYVPHVIWNARIRRTMRQHHNVIKKTLREWHELVTSRYDQVNTVALQADRMCVRFPNQADAQSAANVLRMKAQTNTMLDVFQYFGEVDVRVLPTTKGMALRQLAEHAHIRAAESLAIGDGHNDLALMDPNVALFTGCPANAKEEIVEAVHIHGGHIARENGLKGVMEILHAYTTDTIDNALPDGWRNIKDKDNPVGPENRRPRIRHSRQANYRRSQHIKALCILSTAVYITALIFAHYNLIPFSRIIRMPYEFVMHVIVSVFGKALEMIS